MSRFIPLVWFLLIATTSLVAQAPGSNSTLSSNRVFQTSCAKCPASAEELRNIIANGKGRMPKYAGKLSEDEINSLVQQIKSLNQK